MKEYYPEQELLDKFIKDLDAIIMKYDGQLEAHNVSALLLSRVILLETMEPEVGKQLVKFVWEKLDEIEQANPGSMIP
jgi:hypothetical protein